MKKNLKETVAQEIEIAARKMVPTSGICPLLTINDFRGYLDAAEVKTSIDTIRAAVKDLVSRGILEVVEQPHIKKGAVAYRIPPPSKEKKVSKMARIREALFTQETVSMEDLMTASGYDRKNVHVAIAILKDPYRTKNPLVVEYDKKEKNFTFKGMA